MLFVQQIEIEYRKNVRYANFAQARNAIKFYPVRINPDEIQQNVLFHSAFFYQDTNGMHNRGTKSRQFTESQLYDGKFNRSPFGKKIGVKPIGDNQYEVHFYGGFDKTAFVLRKDQYGRIVFNERNTYLTRVSGTISFSFSTLSVVKKIISKKKSSSIRIRTMNLMV